MMLGLEFPPLGHLVDWPEFGPGSVVNKVVVIYAIAGGLTMLLFILGNRKKELVPTGWQNAAEIGVEFVEDQIVLPTIGPQGLRYAPLLTSFFFFIFFCNIFEIIPLIQMPATARIALPMFLALLAYCVYHGAGFREHGFFGYLKHALVPPGVPVFMLPLMVLIEFVSKFIITPFSHMVRLFANLLAGHILLVTFAVLTSALFTTEWYLVFLPLPFIALVFFTVFEILVSFLQAYVFALLAGVYIGMAISHEH